ncbi:MAG TPA: fumarylacetoacetase [Acidimicrobiales bacterium]|nr:fumarylacetoacetase [Acidimicrobiales bacterium]
MTAYGVFSTPQDDMPRIGFLDDDGWVLDLRSAGADGALGDANDLVQAPSLNPLLAAGHDAWSDVAAAVEAVAARRDRALLDPAALTMHLPFVVGDYVDFYSSIEHATNLGLILRPDGEPLLDNWRHMPVGYHGRAGTVVVSGTPVRRPWGQTRPTEGDSPNFGPTRMLDFELEVAFVTGDGPPLATPIPTVAAERHIFGLVLVNDWSARDLQSWEYQPLGPFLAKSFQTSVAPWVVPVSALIDHRVAGPMQTPLPLPHLRSPEPRNLDVHLEVHLRTARMVEAGEPHAPIASTNLSGMYWSLAQQLAHLTSNGATVRAGDLCASGTVSGSTPGSEGSLMERTWRGTRPITLPNGEIRRFLEDGDEVRMTGRSGVIDFGSVVGRVWE